VKNRYSKYKVSGLVSFDDVPSHWKKNRIKYIGFMYGGLTGKSGDDFRMDEGDPSNKPFIPFTNICNNTYIKGSDLKLVSINENDNQNRVEKDDLFFMMTSETQEDVGKTSVLKEDLGEVYLNTFCKGFRITDRSVNPYFLNYLLNGKPYRELLSVEGNGFTRINLRQDRVNDFVLFTPSITEQEQIVKYLDEKTPQIDQLISITEKKIEGLKEKRTSLINHVVTKGLDSNVEMKDSGIEWIGKIPKHWNVKKLGYLGNLQGRIGYKGYTKEDFVDEGQGCLVLGGKHIDKNNRINLSDPEYLNWDKYYESPEIMVKKGDIIISQRGTLGKCLFIDDDYGELTINPSLVVFNRITEYPMFIWYNLQCDYLISSIDIIGSTTTIPMLSQIEISSFKMIVPPLSEQEEIVQHLDTQSTEINKLVSIEQLRIETLKEYRQSLISEVVTGKIRVCGEVPEFQES